VDERKARSNGFLVVFDENPKYLANLFFAMAVIVQNTNIPLLGKFLSQNRDLVIPYFSGREEKISIER